ncbi:MAG: efflux RND transporter periplasmic adaptor subunit [Planctomycetaceae bacterium]
MSTFRVFDQGSGAGLQERGAMVAGKEGRGLHVELYRLVATAKGLDPLRSELRRLLLEQTTAVCAAHVVLADENAAPSSSVQSSTPSPLILLGCLGAESLWQRCQESLQSGIRQALQSGRLQFQTIDIAATTTQGDGSSDERKSVDVPRSTPGKDVGRHRTRDQTKVGREPAEGWIALSLPLMLPSCRHEVLVLIVPHRLGEVQSAAVTLEVVAGYQRIAARGFESVEGDWQLSAMAALCELSSQVVQSPTLKDGAVVAANGVQRQLGARMVAIGLGTHGKLRLVAMSGTGELERSSDLHRDLRQAMIESQLRGGQTCYPPQDDTPRQLLLAHQRLAQSTNQSTILSTPLTTEAGEMVGAWVVVGPTDRATGQVKADADNTSPSNPNGSRSLRFLRAAAPHVATALTTVKLATPGLFKRFVSLLTRGLTSRPGWCVLFALVALGWFMTLSAPYRVSCRCRTEAVLSRYASAPHEGLVEQGFVEPGDRVQKGMLLARMDGRELRWELAGVQADRERAARERDMQLTGAEVPQAMLADLETQRLGLKERVLVQRKENLEIVSPIDGIVLSGTLKQSAGRPVTTGEILYEIGPLSPLRIELEVPAADILEIEVGGLTDVWLEGAGGEKITGTILRIRPRSEIRNQENLFIAELEIPNNDLTLRPGMTGTARIEGQPHSLGWRLFHKPWEWVVTRVGW